MLRLGGHCVFPLLLLLLCVMPLVSTEEGDKVCHVDWITIYGDSSLQFRRLKEQYDNCTHVIGNLIIANLYDPIINYDLSFLARIRYVSGYVAIFSNSYPATVSLPSLEVIRGNRTFRDRPVKGLWNISLLIAVNDHEHVLMPRLKEVSSGNALIDLETSPHLCQLDTIDWHLIVREGTAQLSANHAACPPCSEACRSDCRGRHCWGTTDDLCQQKEEECSEHCPRGMCVPGHPDLCCSPHCAIGCHGSSSRQCTACKDFMMEDGRCSPFCPLYPPHIVNGQNCTART